MFKLIFRKSASFPIKTNKIGRKSVFQSFVNVSANDFEFREIISSIRTVSIFFSLPACLSNFSQIILANIVKDNTLNGPDAKIKIK